MSSSRSGLKPTEGQRLGPLLGALCGPTTPLLKVLCGHPVPQVLAVMDRVFQLIGAGHGAGVTERDLQVDGAHGDSIPARLYTPPGAGENAPLLVFFHGGGFVIGSLDSHRQTCRMTAREAGCKLLAVGYRKAPGRRFPGALEDSTAAVRWAVRHAAALGVDPARIAVGGDSAGGNLAAGVCLAMAQDDVRPCAAWLIYPLVDADLAAWPSSRTYAEGPLLSTPCLQLMLDQYAPDRGDYGDERLSVLRSQRLGVLPPTYVAVAGMDPLRDQGEAFAERTRAAGVPTELRRFDSLPHGFDLLLVDRRAREATIETCRALTRLLTAHTAAPGPAGTGSAQALRAG